MNLGCMPLSSASSTACKLFRLKEVQPQCWLFSLRPVLSPARTGLDPSMRAAAAMLAARRGVGTGAGGGGAAPQQAQEDALAGQSVYGIGRLVGFGMTLSKLLAGALDFV